jgi:hypothetical protein
MSYININVDTDVVLEEIEIDEIISFYGYSNILECMDMSEIADAMSSDQLEVFLSYVAAEYPITLENVLSATKTEEK